MYKKSILIENRQTRQKIYLPNQEKDQEVLMGMDSLSHYENNKQNINEFLKNKNFNFLSEYDLIMVHRSYLNEIAGGSLVNELIRFCEKNQKDLIYFSGGISSYSYSKQEDFNFLLINSKDFYLNLISFLKDYQNGLIENLLELKYGKSWKLSYLLRLRELKKLQDLGEELGTDLKRLKKEMEELLSDDEKKDLSFTIDTMLKEI
jgi:hypothetical protein